MSNARRWKEFMQWVSCNSWRQAINMIELREIVNNIKKENPVKKENKNDNA